MPILADRPVIFLDIDGTLIPFGSVPEGRQRLGCQPVGQLPAFGNPLLDRLNPEHGRRLLELGCELVWATSWMAAANDVVAPQLGLPELAVVTWSDTADEPGGGLHWKTQDLARWAAGRPFVWLDDEITATDRQWVSTRHTAPALLHRVDPRAGLTDDDFSRVRRWLSSE
jgi:HAD domain in Swiss Army Knife RNA repair proteins